ncbi:MAG: polysaccharide biosynthesis protein [Clostridia bacterium]|nr:polysaccharide biosynthesis protein [Clostridia bacterium]
MLKLIKTISNFLFRVKPRRAILLLIDIFCFITVNAAYYFLSGTAAFSTPVNNALFYLSNSALLLCSMLFFRFVFRIYNNIWRYTNTAAYAKLITADIIGGIVAILISRFVILPFVPAFYLGIWLSITVISLTTLLTLFLRCIYRLLYKQLNLVEEQKSIKQKTPIAIIGAGQLGAHLANELRNSPNSQYNPVCFLDIDKSKSGKRIAGLPVYSAKDTKRTVEKYKLSEVVVAIARISSEKTEELWNKYTSLGCKVKIYDSPFHEDSDDANRKRVVRDFAIEDLLFRNPLDINKQAEFDYYKDKTILVTGGGGSIGSEICRQVAKCNPKKLIIFDIYENNAYDIQQELIRKYGSALDLDVEIGSVRDVERLECIFENHKPDIVFHAAAHKHVPLMERSSSEAIKNNVIGTYNTANMAEKCGVQKFILISTDKAVNPTNIMGASKRLCEMVVQCRNDSNTKFAAVRFGNVLGSNGSVIPLFKRQIAAGGPITITDKRIIRYFMTIPEASQLVMLAGAKAKKGELFVLDMGQPVRIYDLATNMIRLMGYTPGKDIEIKEIGLRPGEKLYEELLMKNETLIETDNKMIFIEKDTPYTRAEVDDKLKILLNAVNSSAHEINSDAVKIAIKETVPTFVEPETINKDADKSKEMKNTLIQETSNNIQA